ncbi:amino acid adenylation domain-containing protein, partial [Sinorhizobium sp. CB9]
VLGLERVGIHDNFFEIGGHSLTAVRLTARLRQGLGHDVSLRTLFSNPTVAGIAALIEGQAQIADAPILPRPKNMDRLPLSAAQERLWFLWRLEPESTAYTIAGAVRLDGVIDVGALRDAFADVVRRHEILRTKFGEDDGIPYQMVEPSADPRWDDIDLAASSIIDQEAKAKALVEEMIRTPFDLEAAPPLRLFLIRLGRQTHLLVLALHHILMDGPSLAILVDEVNLFYESRRGKDRSRLPDLAIQFADFALWQKSQENSGKIAQDLSYWTRQLRDYPEAFHLAPAHAVARRGDQEDDRPVRQKLPPHLTRDLRALAVRTNTTLFSVLLGCFNWLLHRHSARGDLAVAVPVSSRQRQEVEALIGPFLNLLIIRSKALGPTRFDAFLKSAIETIEEALDHQSLPFERLVKALAPAGRSGSAPFTSVKFLLHDLGYEQHSDAALRWTSMELPNSGHRFDLNFNVLDFGDGLEVSVSYDPAYLDRAEVKTLVENYIQVMLRAVLDEHHTLDSIALLKPSSPSESAPMTSLPTVIERVADFARLRPEEPAIIDEDATISWRELWERAGRLSKQLRRRGIRPQTSVAVLLERSAELVVAILAIWRAGAVYAPLDASSPAKRLRWQLHDLNARHVVSHGQLDWFDDAIDVIDVNAQGPSDPPEIWPCVGPAYVIYTSGSSGEPKGVVVTHESLLDYVDAVYDRLPGDLASAAYVSSPAADLGHTSLFGALLRGMTLLVIGRERAFDPDGFADSMRKRRPDLLKITPSHLVALLNAADPAAILPGRCLVLGGEQPSQRLLQTIGRLAPDLTVVNHYGPTEATVGVIAGNLSLTGFGPIALGEPLAHGTISILDDRGGLLADGEAGELCIGGRALALGYLNKPGLTADRFVPAANGQRLYRTGDKARRLSDGRIEFLGRLDNQVKIRGYRVELDEIRRTLLQHPSVNAATLATVEDDGRTVLRASVATDDRHLSESDLRHYLAEHLPSYMIPNDLRLSDRLEVTENGKAVAIIPEAGEPSSISPVEAALLAIWRDILKRDDIDVTQDFFSLGGDSILTLQVIARAKKAGIKLTPKQFFAGPSIRQIAAVATKTEPVIAAAPQSIERAQPEPGQLSFAGLTDEDIASLDIAIDDVQDIYPATPLQEGLLFHSLLDQEAGVYVNQLTARFGKDANRPLLRNAWQAIVDRHDILRTSFIQRQDGPALQVVRKAVKLAYRDHDWRDLDPSQYERAFEEWRTRDLAVGIDPGKAPLLRVATLLAPDDHVDLVWTYHHAITDGWSTSIILKEVLVEYRARMMGDAARHAPIVPFRRYIDWLGAHRAAEPDWWSDRLSRIETATRLVPSLPTATGNATTEARHEFGSGQTDKIRAFARRSGVTVNTVVQAAWALVISHYTSSSDIVFGVTLSGRPVDLEGADRIVGPLINSLPLVLTLPESMDVVSWLRQVQQENVALRDREHMPLLELQQRYGRRDEPLFDTLLVFENYLAQESADEADILDVSLTQAYNRTHYPVTIVAAPEQDRLRLQLTGDGKTVSSATSGQLLRHLVSAIEAITDGDGPFLGKISIIPEQEAAAALGFGESRPAPTAPRGARIHDLFAVQVAAAPNAIALRAGKECMTFGELDDRSNRLARHLQTRGHRSEEVIGLYLDQSLEMFVGLLGILKAGCAYLPLTLDLPEARLEHLIGDASVKLVLTKAAYAPNVSSCAEAFPLDQEQALLAGVSCDPVENDATSQSLAYVIYTSGSSGLPKGVMVPHSGVVNYLTFAAAHYAVAAGGGAPVSTSIGFDATVTSTLLPLVCGTTVHILGEDAGIEGLAAELNAGRGFSLVKATPSHLDALKHLLAHETLESQTNAYVIGGENLIAETIDLWRRLAPATRLINEYGPTETVVGCAVHEVDDASGSSGPVPIGRPIANTDLYVLNRFLNSSGIGVIGELYVGGKGVTRGYRGKPGQTAAVFIPHPRRAGERLYRTGDLARWRKDGILEYIGRNDFQVKIRGHRIELGEIQAALLGHAGVREAAVIALDDAGGGKRLAAYVVAVDEDGVTAEALRTHLGGRLPSYMVPAAITFIDAMPLTVNGKLDRRALPDPELSSGSAYVAPRTETEAALAAIWRDVLGLERVGVNDNFFEIGGHSLTAVRLTARLRQGLGHDVSLRALFDHPTVCGIAALIEGKAAVGQEAIPPRPAGLERIPLSPAQERLWFLWRLDPDSAAYTIAGSIRLEGALDADAMRSAAAAVVARHESLRTR